MDIAMRVMQGLNIPFLKPKRRVLMTEIGGGSSGDQALYLAAAQQLRKAGNEVSLLCRLPPTETFHCANLHVPMISAPMHQDYETTGSATRLISEFESREPEIYHAVLRAFQKIDVVVTAPGGRLLDGYKTVRNLIVPAMALEMGIPLINLHQSVGPLKNPVHRKLLFDVFARAALTVARDDISFAFLHEIGIPGIRTFPGRDIIFGEIYPKSRKHPEYDLGVNVRIGFNGHAKLDVLRVFLSEYLRHNPSARVLIYSTTHPLGDEVSDTLSELQCTLEKKVPVYPDYLRSIGRCAIHVTDSFHGVIFSMMAQRPVICCQTDFDSWKLQGTLVPGQAPLEILEGFTNAPSARVVLDRVLEAGGNPTPYIERQMRFLSYCKKRCEEGWHEVHKALKSC